jgi:protein-disulfide isomerase
MNLARNSTQELDEQQLRTCIQNQETLSEVQRDRNIGAQAGIRSTPSVFVNGTMVQNWSYPQLKAAIEEELEK